MKAKRWLLPGAILLLLLGGVLLWRGLSPRLTPAPETQVTPAPTVTPEPTAAPTAAPEPADTATPGPTPTPTPYVSPIDFEALWAVNEDIYAWLEIPGTDISYPVVQHPTDNAFYMDHNSDGAYSANGSIFSEDYNATDMLDPVTILYGHHMRSGAMFGNLQQLFTDPTSFGELRTLVVYTPDAAYEYRVFAAVPYSSEHILYYHDFTDENEFDSFFYGIRATRSLNARVREDDFPAFGDNVLILSTCLAGDNSQRFLVLGTRSAEPSPITNFSREDQS